MAALNETRVPVRLGFAKRVGKIDPLVTILYNSNYSKIIVICNSIDSLVFRIILLFVTKAPADHCKITFKNASFIELGLCMFL